MPTGKSSSLNIGQSTLSTAASSLVAQNLQRVMLQITNDDAAIKVYAGSTSAVSTTTGMVIKGGATLVLDNYTGPIFLVAASGTPAVTFLEY